MFDEGRDSQGDDGIGHQSFLFRHLLAQPRKGQCFSSSMQRLTDFEECCHCQSIFGHLVIGELEGDVHPVEAIGGQVPEGVRRVFFLSLS